MSECSNQDASVILKDAWETILQKSDVKENDHFFLLGGDSLLGSMLILSLLETAQIEITLGDLYANPTLKGLSAFINEQQQEK